MVHFLQEVRLPSLGAHHAFLEIYQYNMIFNIWYLCMGFPGRSAGKESACNVGDLGSIPGLGRSPGEGKGYPLQYSGYSIPLSLCIVKYPLRVKNKE